MVFEQIRKGLKQEPPVIGLLKQHKWASDAQKQDLIQKFMALPNLEVEDLVWTATDQTPEIRSAGLQLLKRQDPKAALPALTPLLRTRSEAVRRAVQKFIKDVAGEGLAAFLHEQSERGDDFTRLAVIDLSRDLPPERAFPILKKIIPDPHPVLRSRALKAISEHSTPATAHQAANIALPLLQDDDEEIRLAALAVLEKNPSENLITHVLGMARSTSTRVIETAFVSLSRLLPTAQKDHTGDILPLLGDGNAAVRKGALGLLAKMPPDRVSLEFVKTYKDSYSWVRDRAMAAASEGMPNFVPLLLQLSRHPDPAVAEGALEMSLSVDDARAIPVWLYLLRHPDWWTRSCAVECLGKHGAGREDVLNALLAMLQDPEIAMGAAAALGQLADPRSVNHLFQLFQKAQPHPDDQVEILDSMAAVGAKVPQMGPWMAQLAANTAVDMRVREKARRLVGKLQGDAARDAIPRVVFTPKSVDLSAIAEPKLIDFLADLVAKGGSDFHIATGFQPHRRIHGILEPVEAPVISAERAETLLREVLSDEEWQTFMRERQLDVCLKIQGLGRFRANFFSQRAGLDASFRAIPQNLPILEEIGLPESVWEVTRFTQGLVLVTGPAGCGKSTTLAALVNKVNETRAGHIITIEDPIEFIHPNKESLVNQRQVPHHTASFARALKAALREDPDVIMVGEMRDLETIALAISASETGHLVFGTLSTTTATATMDRVINSFPAGQQGQIRSMISESLKAVISQALLPRRGGYGRVAAFEILRNNAAVAAMVRDGKNYQLPSILQTGQLSGMNTMDQALLKLIDEGKITPEVGMDRAVKKEPFEKMMQEERLALA
ncbi:MAG: hypothetical protein DIJKHBIC_01898 [Thermoanaerobaculia bacterium]|nr:hypothetical protein [Thermoanaerobaculia bacterium]